MPMKSEIHAHKIFILSAWIFCEPYFVDNKRNTISHRKAPLTEGLLYFSGERYSLFLFSPTGLLPP